MKTVRMLAPLLGFILCLGSSLTHAESFVIELHNGRELITPHVWEEGNEIKFSIAEGTAGLNKTQVKSIKAALLRSYDRVSRMPQPASANAPKSLIPVQRSEHTSQTRADLKGEESSVQAYREQKSILTSKVNAATERYLQASGARDPEAKQQALQEMREYSKRIYALADEIKEKSGGTLPAWWNE